MRNQVVTTMRTDPRERFWRMLSKDGPECADIGRCWIWTACKTKAGYGQIAIAGKRIYAHRFAYETLVGQIPEGVEVMHRCDNPSCVNPVHLTLGTHKENGEDMVGKGRQDKGEDRWSHKLTEKDVAQMRSLYRKGVKGRGYICLSRMFGVSMSTAREAITGATWRHVGGMQ